MALGVSDGVGASFHLVFEPGPISAFVAGVHQGAYGLREAPGVSRRHNLQQKHFTTAANEETGHLQRGTVARDLREKLAGFRRGSRRARIAR